MSTYKNIAKGKDNYLFIGVEDGGGYLPTNFYRMGADTCTIVSTPHISYI